MPLANVSAAVLSEEQIATLRAKLTRAEADRGSLSDRLACFGRYVAEQQARSAEQQSALASVLQRRDTLATEITQGEVRQRGFENLVDAERSNVESKRQDYERARSEQNEQAERLRICRAVLFLFPWVCNEGEAFVRAAGWMRNAEADFHAEAERLRNAEHGLHEAHDQLARNRSSLSQAQEEAEANRRSVQDIEGGISRAQAASAVINAKMQNYDLLIGSVEETLKDAHAVDPEDARLRRVNTLSRELDAFSSGIADFVAKTEDGMPEDVKQRCSR
ncbi:hypothetical protein SQ03_12875 [Methylobacterium platani JCM 14648]|uniref:Chromosome segregation protein SMC n=2 Tax=Methylobacterium platani TaxID=427683 RepID=A0A179SCL8_9HYPH|nr:hypothetical protein SQ03_12875 [Methylobacterium platani JCM 14648]OAS25609.1 hypothetical protein A5481_09705 [Methylobacterium platani]